MPPYCFIGRRFTLAFLFIYHRYTLLRRPFPAIAINGLVYAATVPRGSAHFLCHQPPSRTNNVADVTDVSHFVTSRANSPHNVTIYKNATVRFLHAH